VSVHENRSKVENAITESILRELALESKIVISILC